MYPNAWVADSVKSLKNWFAVAEKVVLCPVIRFRVPADAPFKNSQSSIRTSCASIPVASNSLARCSQVSATSCHFPEPTVDPVWL